MDKPRIPRTKAQKGAFWATGTLVLCGAFSIYSNVRSGQIEAENIIVSVFPPIVSFFASHLISYFSPRNIGQKLIVWGGMGLVVLFSMIGSGWHIVENTARLGQPIYVAIMYVFITDMPMLLAGVIIATKVSTTVKTDTTVQKSQSTPKKAVAAKATNAPQTPTAPVKRATPAKATTPAKRTSRAKAPQEAEPAFSSKAEDISMDSFEQDMLKA